MKSLRFPAGLDPFVLLLIGTVTAATFVPASGGAATVFGWAADIAIGLLFFLHGARLSTEAILKGVAKWRLHLAVLASTFVLFPTLGLGLAAAGRPLVGPEILAGFVYLSLLPSTVQSSIAFTTLAGGDVPAAMCSASLSNIIGVFLTPALAGVFLHATGAGGGLASGALTAILLQLLAPFVAGHLARPLIGAWVARHKLILAPVDRGSILLVVYTAFSAAVLDGLWQRTGAADLSMILGLCALLLALVMGLNLTLARLVGMPREDEIVLLFCGSKKSLVSGVPMAGALFPSAQLGVMILPLIIFHQLQLFVCTVIAARYRSRLVEDSV